MDDLRFPLRAALGQALDRADIDLGGPVLLALQLVDLVVGRAVEHHLWRGLRNGALDCPVVRDVERQAIPGIYVGGALEALAQI